MVESGITGSVALVGRKGDEQIIKDLSAHKWMYKVGLRGMEHKYYSLDSGFATKWLGKELPINRMMTWYKVYVKTIY